MYLFPFSDAEEDRRETDPKSTSGWLTLHDQSTNSEHRNPAACWYYFIHLCNVEQELVDLLVFFSDEKSKTILALLVDFLTPPPHPYVQEWQQHRRYDSGHGCNRPKPPGAHRSVTNSRGHPEDSGPQNFKPHPPTPPYVIISPPGAFDFPPHHHLQSLGLLGIEGPE